MKHVLALSTLYPNPANPRFGPFVARSLEALARQCEQRAGADRGGADRVGADRGDWQVTVINPIGLPPLGLGALSPLYRELDDLPERAVEGGIEVHRPRFALIPKLGARRNAAAIARAVLPLARAIHADRPVDVVSAQFFFPDGPAAARIAHALERPLSIKARGSDITYWGGVAAARAQMLEAAGAADGLLAVSAALAEEMAALGMPGEQVEVHYTGLDRDRFRPLGHTQLRAQLGTELGFALPPGAPLFASVGALVERKGHAITIAALAQLSEQHPDARLLVVGRGEEESSLRQLASEHGLSDRVHFTGVLDHDILPLVLSAADAMVLPSANEGLANAWVEALACGTPLVTCDVGGARELVTSALAGRLVERTPAGVAGGMAAVLADPPNPQDVAALVEAFDWVTHADRLAAHFERLCADA